MVPSQSPWRYALQPRTCRVPVQLSSALRQIYVFRRPIFKESALDAVSGARRDDFGSSN